MEEESIITLEWNKDLPRYSSDFLSSMIHANDHTQDLPGTFDKGSRDRRNNGQRGIEKKTKIRT